MFRLVRQSGSRPGAFATKAPEFRESEAEGRDAVDRRGSDPLWPLAQAVLEGDAGAERTLVAQLTPQLLRVVRKTLGPAAVEVEDVTYEALHAVLVALGGFRGEASVSHFACRVAVLTAMNHRRKASRDKRSALFSTETGPDELASTHRQPDEQLDARDCARAVRELMTQLPDCLAEALTLHAVLGLTSSEVAEATGAPLETVRSRLKLARRALRQQVLEHPVLREVRANELGGVGGARPRGPAGPGGES